uniref:Uncharacterized protein n=1 Tax=uncultured marine group II/III euryarchaeote AD1000_88_G11 TaxID=1457822 RepID=A0A075FYZ8_9EURY|nr:hypothetical protein [uncultured marine group II/III euryarchaeote AD1000_88_G11]
MGYNSLGDFSKTVNDTETSSLQQGLRSLLDRNFYRKLVPLKNISLCQEGFNNGDNCKTFCGKKPPYCKDKLKGQKICSGKTNLNTKEKCESESCEWSSDTLKECTPQCKKWNCDNCKGQRSTSDIEQLEQLYNDTLEEYKNDYKTLTSGNLTDAASLKISKKVRELNTSLLKIADELYQKIVELQNSHSNNEEVMQKTNSKKEDIVQKMKQHGKELEDSRPSDHENGVYAGNEIKVKYAYYHYLLWLIIATVLIGGITLLVFNIPLPTLNWPYNIVYLVVIVFFGWFLFSNIWKTFWGTVRYLTS